MRTKRTFTREFKREAACLVLDQGYSVRDVCTQLDLQEGALRHWVQQLRFELPEPLRLVDLEAPVLTSPVVEGADGDAELPTQVTDLGTSFLPLDSPDDLLFAVTLLHDKTSIAVA